MGTSFVRLFSRALNNPLRRFGVYSIDHAYNAGLDLEMPGTNKWRTLNLVNRSYVFVISTGIPWVLMIVFNRIESRKIMVRTVKERAKKVLELTQKCAQGAPEVKAPIFLSET